jgi:hypothetical protein
MAVSPAVRTAGRPTMTLSSIVHQCRPSALRVRLPGFATLQRVQYDAAMAPRLAILAAVALLGGCDRLAALAASNPLQSFESRCEALPAGRVEVRRLPVAVAEDYTVPVSQLARMSAPTSTHHRTIGLTRAKFGYRSTLELEGLEDAKGARACARPQVKIDIEVTGTTVYVAREFHGDACREPLILAHERLHVAVFDRYADEATASLAREIEARLGKRVRYGASMVAVQDALKRELAGHLEGFMDRARDELDRRHAAIDTPDEYDRMTRTCGGLAVTAREGSEPAPAPR